VGPQTVQHDSLQPNQTQVEHDFDQQERDELVEDRGDLKVPDTSDVTEDTVTENVVHVNLDEHAIIRCKLILEDNSRFQAFYAEVTTLEEVNRVEKILRLSADGNVLTHLMFAYRLDPNVTSGISESCVDIYINMIRVKM
jgi:hypothetical protein